MLTLFKIILFCLMSDIVYPFVNEVEILKVTCVVYISRVKLNILFNNLCYLYYRMVKEVL